MRIVDKEQEHDANNKRVKEFCNGATMPRRTKMGALAPQEALVYVRRVFIFVVAISLAIVYGVLYLVDK
jgi:hypothetical protein